MDQFIKVAGTEGKVGGYFCRLPPLNKNTDVGSGSDITPFVKTDKPLVVYIFSKVMLWRPEHHINRGSYVNTHVLLNLLNELGKSDKMWGLPSILSLFRNKFNELNNTVAGMLDDIKMT